jgi:hypothetical protein
MAALARWQSSILDATGVPVAGASVAVYSETTGALATVYSDRAGTTTTTNPLTTDADGFVGFYVYGDAYNIVATYGTTSRQFRYVGIGTASEEDKPLIVIADSTFSGSSNVIFSGMDLYRKIEIDVEYLVAGTDTASLYGYISTDSGVSYIAGTSNAYSLDRATVATAALSGSAGAAQLLLSSSLGTGAGEFYQSSIVFVGHTETSIYKTIRADGIVYDSTPALRTADFRGLVLTGAAITNFALQMSTGTMSGRVIMRGELL